jgi:hypothetical protein
MVETIELLSKLVRLASDAKDFFAKFETRKSKLFNKHIAPAFETLQLVIKYYADNIATFRSDVSKAKDRRAVEKAILRFREERRKTVQLRNEIVPALRSALDYMELNLDEKDASTAKALLRDFMINLCRYFESPAIKKDDFTKPGSMAVGLLRLSQGYLEGYDPAKAVSDIEQLVSLCDDHIEILEARTEMLHRSFMTLKLECIEN